MTEVKYAFQENPSAFGKEFDMDDHQISVEELCSKFGTHLCFGLTKEEVEEHLARDGKNLMNPNRGRHEIYRLVTCVFCGVGLCFWLTALQCFVTIVILKHSYDEIGIPEIYLLLTLIFNALFVGLVFYAQDTPRKLSDAVPSLKNLRVEVIREGQRMSVLAEDVVVGDLILLKFGETIPADIRITESQNFKVDNFALTGVHDSQTLHERTNETNPLESPNIAFFPATVVDGTARGIVIRTGRRTLLGRIFGARKVHDRVMCPVTRIIIECLNKSAILAFCLAWVFFFAFWLTTGRRATDASLVSILFVLGTIPEDLLRTMCICYLIYSRKMAGKSCFMKNIAALQKLPFVRTICLNKPGILTVNKVMVSNLWFNRRTVEVWGGSKMVWKERTSLTFKELARAAVLCNDADFKADQTNIPLTKRQITGTVNDVAILKFFASTIGKKVERLREAHQKMYCIPGGITSRCQVSVHRSSGNYLVVLIGDPEHLLDICTTFLQGSSAVPINDGFMRDLDRACVQFAKNGDVIKCVVEQMIPAELEDFDPAQFKIPETGYQFLGLITLIDSPRSNLARAIAKCKKAGIKVILTTNDHPITARSFARNIGVISETSLTVEEMFEKGDDQVKQQDVSAVVIDGMQLKKLSVGGMQTLMAKYTEVVFARTSPIQKLMLVATCQKNNSIVAVVGDGVNDALTMKKADVSITLQQTNVPDHSKIKADVCISDDTFYSLATCIEEGRLIYENLKKCSAYTLTSNVAIVLPLVAYCLVGLPLPVNPIGLVIIEILLELFPAVSLALERGDRRLMEQPPRHVTDKFWSHQMFFYACVQIGVIETFACFFTYFTIMQEFGWSPVSLIGIRDRWDSVFVTDLEDSYGQMWSYEARKNLEMLSQTGYFYCLVFVQCANLLVCRHQLTPILRIKDRNWVIHFGLLFELSLTFFIIYLPDVNDLTHMKPLKPIWWLLPFPYLFLIIFYDEIKKFVVRRFPKGWFARQTIY